MATKTTNYELTKPSGTESADIDVINANMDIIDGALNDKADVDHTHDEYLPLTGGQMSGGIEATGALTSYEGLGVMASTILPWQLMLASTVLDTVGIGCVNTSNNISLLGVKGQEPIFIPDVDAQPMVSEVLAFKSDIPDVSGFALKTEIPDISGKADADHTHSEYATKTELEGKADSGHTHDNYATKGEIPDVSGFATKSEVVTSAGTGLSISGTTINHSNSVTAKTSYVGSATAVPRIMYDAQGHITGTTTATIYPPTSAGSNGQVWRSDGSGAGAWETPDTTPTSGSTKLVTSGAVYTAVNNAKVTVDDALSSTSTNPLQNKVVNNAIYNLGVQIRAEIPNITISNQEPSGGSHGDIWFKYSE